MIVAALLVTILLEQALFSRLIWEIRRPTSIALVVILPAITGVMLLEYPHWLGVTVALFSVGRVVNLIRIVLGRMHNTYLKQVTGRTSRAFCALQILVLPFLVGALPGGGFTHLPMITAVIQIVVATSLLAITIRNVYKTRYRRGNTFYADRELPTVSLVIPARNETTDLEECLRSAIASDYPKLEIIVLDDCSQLKTSDIIKGFAHDGVRFIQGDEPGERWLAKNQAYQKLYEEASGELVLFCGVDVRFGTHAIKALVTELLVRDKQMVSVLPRRLSGNVAGAFIQPMRYWWELALPRTLFNRPPVLSTCWLIRHKTLKKLGGFGAVSHSILPEGFFARELVKTDGYSFIRANDTLDVQTHKSFAEQRATAIRTRYPQLRRRPENVLLLIAAELTFLLGPFVGLIYGLVASNNGLLILSFVAASLLIFIHLLIIQITSPANVVVALVNFPVEVITGVVVGLISMWRYEFGTVEWKDRNVCIPVMHVIPHLPPLQNKQ